MSERQRRQVVASMRTVFVILIFISTVVLDSPAQNFTIKGHFADVANDTLLIEYVVRNPEKRVMKASVPIDANGFFNYACDIQWAYNAELTVRSNGNKSYFFFVPDESVEIDGTSGSTNYWDIKGSAFYQKMDSIRQSMLPFYKELDAVNAEYDKGVAEGLDKTMLAGKRKAARIEINKRLFKVVHQYIMNHLDDDVSAAMLLDQDFNDILPAINKLSPEVRNGRFKDYIDVIESMFLRVAQEVQASKAATLELKEGEPVPDFTLKDIKGNDFRLGTLLGKGKYIVVDFWGSWCRWCIKGFPKMAEYYNRYKDKLEIVGVACHDKEDRWKEAVSRNNASWLHVISPDGTTEVRFGVTAYPYKVIVSPQGIVVKCFSGETVEFYKMLDEVLK